MRIRQTAIAAAAAVLFLITAPSDWVFAQTDTLSATVVDEGMTQEDINLVMHREGRCLHPDWKDR